MDEYVKRTTEQAAKALQEIFDQEALPGANPLLELMGLLLGDGFGEVQPTAAVPITSQQWLDWHHLASTTPGRLLAVMNFILETERPRFPTERTAMRIWAASLLLNTLDQFEMM